MLLNNNITSIGIPKNKNINWLLGTHIIPHGPVIVAHIINGSEIRCQANKNKAPMTGLLLPELSEFSTLSMLSLSIGTIPLYNVTRRRGYRPSRFPTLSTLLTLLTHSMIMLLMNI